MSGPTLHVLTPIPVGENEERRVRDFISAVASRVNGNDFWVASQPFVVYFGDLQPEDSVLEFDSWKPKGAVGYAAMCNGQTDHVLLAFLAHRTAQLLGGRIDLDDIRLVTSNAAVLTLDGYRPVDGRRYIVEPSFLGHWMGADDFRLLK